MPSLRSIRFKVFAVIAAMTLAIVAFLATYFPARQIDAERAALEEKAATYGRLLAKESESAIAFQDRETAREDFEAVSLDPDVRALALYTEGGVLFYAQGELTDPPAGGPGFASALRTESGERFVRCSAPVVSKEGPRGVLVVELSTEPLVAERLAIRRAAGLIGLGALAIGFVAAWLIGRSLGKRLGAITTVTNAVAEGDLSQEPVADRSPDDIGQLARSFNRMLAKIKGLVAHISEVAAEETTRLDALVKLRTEELDARNEDMRRVLENVGEGFLMLDREGVMSTERSAIVDEWLGVAAAGVTFAGHIASIDARASTWFQLGWEAIVDDVLPLELALAQMPKTMACGDAILRLGYRPIAVDGVLSRVLLVISDVTPEIARERAEASHRETLVLFERATRDRSGVLEFLTEAEEILRVIADPSSTLDALKRAVHTLKGNAGSFGLFSVAEACHRIEDAMSDLGGRPSVASIDDLAARWTAASSRAFALLGEGRRKIEIEEGEHAALLDALGSGVSRSELTQMVSLWKLEATATRLQRVAEQTHALAARLGKPAIAVRIEHNGLRLDATRWSPFWSAFVHAVRNAVDHGIEPEDERRGKSGAGTIRLRTFLSGPDVVVEIADDGRGIDWDALTERGKSLGLAHHSRAALESILYESGASTKEKATEHSGRGIGMGALRAACEALGGTVKISSVRGQGTTFQFWVPAEPFAGVTAPSAGIARPVPPGAYL